MSTSQLMSPEIHEIALALSKFQSSIQNVIKNKAGYEYKYAELSEYLNTIRGPMAENDLALVQLIDTNNADQEFLVTMMLHKSGQWIKSTFNLKSQNVVTKDGRNKINDMQSLGSGISYLRRYAIACICGLAQEDDDGASSQYKKKEEARQAAPQELSPGKKLVNLCTQNGIDPGEFAKHFGITKENAESVKKAIESFADMKDNFLANKKTIEECATGESVEGCSDEAEEVTI